MRKPLFLTLLVAGAVLFAGCSKSLKPEQMVGRWVEDKEDRRYEFTPNQLYSVVENGTFVQVGSWTLSNDGKLSLRSLTDKSSATWTIENLGEEQFSVPLDEARFRSFQKIPLQDTIFDQRLVGLWRTEGEPPQILEFTEQATLNGMFQRLDKPGGSLFPLGFQTTVSTAGTSAFFMDGYIGDKRVKKGVLPHPYEIEGARLLWGPNLKRPPTVYRKITPHDIADLAQPTTGPPKLSPTPAL